MRQAIILFSCVIVFYPWQTRAGTFLETLLKTEGGMTLVYGEEAASEEAAMHIRDYIRAMEGYEDWDNVEPAARFDNEDYTVRGQTHIIAVGRLEDNAVVRQKGHLPVWWLDRDWYHQSYEYSKQLLPYQGKTGFVVAGFGEWPSEEQGVGYITMKRSPYFMEWFVRSKYPNGMPDGWNDAEVKDPQYPKDTPMRLMVTITGSGGEGVKAAAEAFVGGHFMLHGAVLASGTAPSGGPEKLDLPGYRYTKSLPFNPPLQDDGNTYTYIGWLLPSAFFYDGFMNDNDSKPRQMYRLKYMPEFGITNFWTTPHRRAGQFEVCVLEFDSASEAEAAEANLKNTAGTKVYSDRIKGLNMVREGNVLCVESLPEPGGSDLVNKVMEAWQSAQ